MSDRDKAPVRLRWAQLRFSIVGPLLADPPYHGDLRRRLEELVRRTWRHPTTGEAVRFGVSTLERWFYIAKSSENAVEALARKVPKHAGMHPSLSEAMQRTIEMLYREHPGWTFQLHHENLAVLVEQDPSIGHLPSYTNRDCVACSLFARCSRATVWIALGPFSHVATSRTSTRWSLSHDARSERNPDPRVEVR